MKKSKKSQQVKSLTELMKTKIVLEELDIEFCLQWIDKNRNRNRIFFPEYWGIVMPVTEKYITDMLGYEYSDKLDKNHTVVIVMTDMKMKHMYAHAMVEFQQIAAGRSQDLLDVLERDAMVRFEL